MFASSALLGALVDIPPLTARDVVLRLLAVLVLIAINAFFVTAEFAIVSVRRSRISQLVEAGDARAKTVQSLQRGIDRLLSTTQLGITLSSLALGWVGERTMAVAIAAGLVQLPLAPDLRASIAHSISIPLAFILLVYLQIVLGELVPKSLALRYAEELARVLGPPSLAIAKLFAPLAWVLNRSTQRLLRAFGIRTSTRAWHDRVTSEELQLIINTERESTGLENDERELLTNILEFGEVEAAAVMVPRTQIAFLPRTATFAELLGAVADSGHSRFPVAGESLDDIRGIIDFKELAEPLVRGYLQPDTLVTPWMRPARFFPEFTPLSELLSQMQRSRLEIAIVVDEFGGTAGLIALRDLVDEIIGDEGEAERSEAVALQMLDEQTFLVQAHMNLEEVNELLDLDLPLADEYQTLGGFLQYQFQKIPVQGEQFEHDALEFTVVAAEGPRLQQIRIHRREATPPVSAIKASGGHEVGAGGELPEY
ncbi:hemolysin [Rubidibacter lacunae KORDI 51-2]|uniref:Hemolysin n=1 Tax=Rubidibacter lacunae KORDI 51-2 TaxID=582515 RepID=U5DAR6_9CHRO|nr:hemolysin family protein [Rubidibacter lacunae]ERN41633.1 hemolysin [Rubidibacter lacunae KORDI 51-2]